MKDIISKNNSTPPCSRFYVNNSAKITIDKKRNSKEFQLIFHECWSKSGEENFTHFQIADKLYDQEL